MNKKHVVLITAPIHSICVEVLKQVAEVHTFDPPLVLEEDIVKAVKLLNPVAIIAVRGVEHIGRKVFENAPNLLVVARNGVGYDKVDVRAATEHGVWVTITPVKELFQAVAEHTIALAMCLARKICLADKDVRRGRWIHENLAGITVENRILGIIGLGRVGTEIARKAKALGMKVVYYDIVRKYEVEKELDVEYQDLYTLLSISDFVVLAVPLTEKTLGMIGEKELKSMKKTAYLINVARGGVVDHKALIRALKEGWIAGAALDVFYSEPLPIEDPLIELSNVILTPHIAWFTDEARYSMAKTAAEEVIKALRCEEPRYVVNAEVKEKAKAKCEKVLLSITSS